jgi:hypothetical protein
MTMNELDFTQANKVWLAIFEFRAENDKRNPIRESAYKIRRAFRSISNSKGFQYARITNRKEGRSLINSRKELRSDIRFLSRKVAPQDNVIIYLIADSKKFPNPEVGGYLPYLEYPDSIDSSSLGRKELCNLVSLMKRIIKLPSRQTILVVDAPHSRLGVEYFMSKGIRKDANFGCIFCSSEREKVRSSALPQVATKFTEVFVKSLIEEPNQSCLSLVEKAKNISKGSDLDIGYKYTVSGLTMGLNPSLDLYGMPPDYVIESTIIANILAVADSFSEYLIEEIIKEHQALFNFLLGTPVVFFGLLKTSFFEIFVGESNIFEQRHPDELDILKHTLDLPKSSESEGSGAYSIGDNNVSPRLYAPNGRERFGLSPEGLTAGVDADVSNNGKRFELPPEGLIAGVDANVPNDGKRFELPPEGLIAGVDANVSNNGKRSGLSPEGPIAEVDTDVSNDGERLESPPEGLIAGVDADVSNDEERLESPPEGLIAGVDADVPSAESGEEDRIHHLIRAGNTRLSGAGVGSGNDGGGGSGSGGSGSGGSGSGGSGSGGSGSGGSGSGGSGSGGSGGGP